MSYRLYIIVVGLWLCATNAHGQLIPWSAERPLVWSDFQSDKPPKKKHTASTYCSIADKINYSTLDSINVTVRAVFNPYRSYKRYGDPGPYLLQHEQSHFDIAELYTRKLRKEVAEAQQAPDHDHHTRDWFSFAYRRKVYEMRHYQRMYDKQTNHSRRREEQERWNKRIATELAELKNYAL